MLWLVNRGIAVRRGRLVKQVCNWKEITRSDLDGQYRGSSQGICSRSTALGCLTIWLARGCKCWHPLAPGRRYVARSLLSEYVSLHWSLKFTNRVPLSRIKWFLSNFPPPPLGQDITRSIFYAEFNGFEFSFPSPRLVASPRLKNLVCRTIYP